jgi:hypothetical protein
MLKKDRWLSVVFQHWNVNYFLAILTAARDSNAELRSAVSQIGDPIWSMHKKKGKESVLAGEFILTFFKGEVARTQPPRQSISIDEIINNIMAKYKDDHIYSEFLLNRLVVEAWRHGTLEELSIGKGNLIDILNCQGWQYDNKMHYWYRPGKRIKSLFEET